MITLNGLPAISARLVTPWRGVWFAEVDIDLTLFGVVPKGKAALVLGKNTLVGTIDARGSGVIGAKAKVRVVGGGGGWDKPLGIVPPFHNDAGVVSTVVLTTVATKVGEIVVEAGVPRIFGVDYVCTSGPASQVLEGSDWYVTIAGITIVGPRVPIPVDPTSIPVLEWHGDENRAVIATDELVLPGMLLIDPRFGTATVRDVEQTFSEDGARANAWCADNAVSRAAAALEAFIKAKAGVALLPKYRYRVVLQGPDGRLQLQAIDRSKGVPDLLFVQAYMGFPGGTCKPALGSEVLVEFTGGDPTRPRVTSFDATPALELDLLALLVKFGVGTSPIVLLNGLLLWATRVEASLTALLQPVVPPLAATPGVASTRVVSD